MGTKLYVGNLDYDVKEAAIEELFAEHGTVVSVKIITDKETNRGKGYAFVEMSTEQEADDAAEALNDSEYNGRTIKVAQAKPQRPKSGGFRGGPRRGGPGRGGPRGQSRGPRGPRSSGQGDSRGGGSYGGGNRRY